ncbi:MAG: GIY-YIG nuclease family protein [Candidatus Roizmanbacteria bacterium]|nr:GIY-YIG nuclease family protein [Candidatus Roizmanbacteria bacterium]
MNYWVYILSNRSNSTLYIGITSNLIKRIYQHKNHLADGFSKKYNLNKLVYYEQYEQIDEAILREKRLKKWNRKWKEELIEKFNAEWNDLYKNIL